MRYPIVTEPTETGYCAYSPDLPRCVATGATPGETESNMREAIEFRIEGLRLEGELVPAASTTSRYVEVPAT